MAHRLRSVNGEERWYGYELRGYLYFMTKGIKALADLAHELGSFRELAAQINYQIENVGGVPVSRAAVHKWVRSGRVPAERVVAVERATGIKRELLRPDLYQ